MGFANSSTHAAVVQNTTPTAPACYIKTLGQVVLSVNEIMVTESPSPSAIFFMRQRVDGTNRFFQDFLTLWRISFNLHIQGDEGPFQSFAHPGLRGRRS